MAHNEIMLRQCCECLAIYGCVIDKQQHECEQECTTQEGCEIIATYKDKIPTSGFCMTCFKKRLEATSPQK